MVRTRDADYVEFETLDKKRNCKRRPRENYMYRDCGYADYEEFPDDIRDENGNFWCCTKPRNKYKAGEYLAQVLGFGSNKPFSEAMREDAKRFGIRLTRTVNGKRKYKTVKLLKQQIANAKRRSKK